MRLLIKVGKKEFFHLDMVDVIVNSPVKKRSRSEVKRLIKEGAIKILVDENYKQHISKNGHKVQTTS